MNAAKTVHRRFKKVELSGAFSGSGPFEKGNDSTKQLLWTNALNMCQILIQKHNLTMIRNNTDEETAKL